MAASSTSDNNEPLVEIQKAMSASDIPEEWKRDDQNALSPDEPVTLWFALKQRNVDLLHKRFVEVSDPSDPSYTNYMTREELRDMVQPTEEVKQNVISFLHANNLPYQFTSCNDFIVVKSTVDQVSKTFDITLLKFVNPERRQSIIRTLDSLKVPASVASSVDFIHGLHHFPLLTRFATVPPAQFFDAPPVTPDIIHKIYSITDKASGKTNSSQGCAEFEGQTYSTGDLSQFEKTWSLPMQQVRQVFGSNSIGFGHVEANLDVQYIIATAQGIPTDMAIDTPFSFDMLKWTLDVEGYKNTPLVWSISYGEALSNIQVDYAQKLDDQFKKLGLLGVSIIFASGDSGVYSRTGGQSKFNPSYPASLPSVTAVGATQLSEGNIEDTAVYFSGGGFGLSNYFTRAANAPWQSQAVSTYLNSNVTLPPSNMYDANGVGFPDVAALGVNFKVIEHHIDISVSGTSAASPTFAGVISLLNDQRMLAGKKPLGFLNPFLYANPHAFHDIVKGNNKDQTKYGFLATPGWDPVTGLGTPNYEALKAAALAAP